MSSAVPPSPTKCHLSDGTRCWIGLVLVPALGLVTACDNGVGKQVNSNQATAASLNKLLANMTLTEVSDVIVKDCTLSITIDYPVQCMPGDDVTLKGMAVSLSLNEFQPSFEVMNGTGAPHIAFVQIWPTAPNLKLFQTAQDVGFAAGVGNYELNNEERRSAVSKREIEFLEAAAVTSRTEIKMCLGTSYFGAPSLNEMRIGVPASSADHLSAELESYIGTHCKAE